MDIIFKDVRFKEERVTMLAPEGLMLYRVAGSSNSSSSNSSNSSSSIRCISILI